ncbi:hypothetical protein CY34DRAFT_810553 [Suillus luteus UH-Slu-Lm8-n1]|uniref:Uncharacterized protein n=1 Tax=Suillus luteus UH-Slu-Lm8-n1 TaxID=930992 RepID=A0A0C9ZIG3_9AGAM|nr:hypothetical protein CY34DRAFT_810553 [Suillus luteus UH-Slu-Lm8-n1]
MVHLETNDSMIEIVVPPMLSSQLEMSDVVETVYELWAWFNSFQIEDPGPQSLSPQPSP